LTHRYGVFRVQPGTFGRGVSHQGQRVAYTRVSTLDQNTARQLDPAAPGKPRHRHAVIGLAHTLGLHVVAEGVETRAQCQQLETLGCDTGQGFYFAEPHPATPAGSTRPRLPG